MTGTIVALYPVCKIGTLTVGFRPGLEGRKMNGEDDPKPPRDAPLEQQGSPEDEATLICRGAASGAMVGSLVAGPVGSVIGAILGRTIALAHDHPRAIPETPLQRSQAAYAAELPQLLECHRGKWVAYADGKRVRIANTQAELYRHCLKELGLPHDRFVVRRVVPDSSSQIEFALG